MEAFFFGATSGAAATKIQNTHKTRVFHYSIYKVLTYQLIILSNSDRIPLSKNNMQYVARYSVMNLATNLHLIQPMGVLRCAIDCGLISAQ